MKVEMFAVYDQAVGAYMQPFFARSLGEAVRMFSATCNDPSTVINKHPDQFTLFKVCDWDDQTGFVTQDKGPISIGVAIEFLETEKSNGS